MSIARSPKCAIATGLDSIGRARSQLSIASLAFRSRRAASESLTSAVVGWRVKLPSRMISMAFGEIDAFGVTNQIDYVAGRA
jgi:hypothetical protein